MMPCSGPFKQAMDALLKTYKLSGVRSAAQPANGRTYSHKQGTDAQMAIADALQAAAKILTPADEPVR